jgi:hypothetical protein
MYFNRHHFFTNMKFLYALYISLFIFTQTFAQFYESGQDPASIRWKQINTPHIQVIFPNGFDSAANRLANTFDYIYQGTGQSLNSFPKKISVVLHSNSAYSNGFVTLAPRRMELYTTPSQSFTALDWLAELPLHEYRHVSQINKINTGFTKWLYPFFGEQAQGAMAGLLPRWFLEGDAVYAETFHSNSGRGRTGSFTMEINALVNELPKLYSFEKMQLGSYRDFVPNHYYSGYFLVSGIREKYGNAVFENSMTYTARNPYIPFSFSHSLKKETGKNSRNLYKEIFIGLKDSSVKNYTKHRDFISYNYPVWVSDSTYVAVKSGIGMITSFVAISGSTEKRIFTPGDYDQSRIAYSNNIIAWTEQIPDKRWDNRTYSCIKTYNLLTHSSNQLTHKTRYFAAALTHDAKKLATVEVSQLNKCSIIILDTQNGKIKETFPAPDNSTVCDPVFTSDDKAILAILVNNNGKAVYKLHLDTKTWEPLTNFEFYNLSCPVESDNIIYYSSDYTGKNEIYRLNSDATRDRISESKYGAFEPMVSGNNLSYADYSSYGYSIKKQQIQSKTEIAFNVPRVYTNAQYETLNKIETFNLQDSLQNSSEAKNFIERKNEVKNYSKISHILNFHSWLPFYYDYNNLSLSNQNLYPGLTILSQDKLDNCVTSLAASYEEGFWHFKPTIIYKGLYPIFQLSMDYGGTRNYDAVKNTDAPDINNYLSLKALIYVPFNLTTGKHISYFTPLIETDYDNDWYIDYHYKYHTDNIFLRTGFNASWYLKLSKRDFAPKYGFTLAARYLDAPFENTEFGYLYYFKPKLYLPGLLPHHSLQITGIYQYNKPNIYYFSSQLSFVRGYSKDEAIETKAINFDYSFPLFYPDWNVGSLLYIKRFRANLFTDQAWNTYWIYNKSVKSQKKIDYSSYGLDLMADFHLFRIFFPITGGLRNIYLPKEKTFLTQLIFSVDLSY